MGVRLIELSDRFVTDSGGVVMGYDLLLKRALSGLPLTGLQAEDHPDVRLYQKRSGGNVKVWTDDGEVEGPSPDTYQWNIPASYLEMDLIQMCAEAMDKKGLTSPEYIDRLEAEATLITERGMTPFFQCLCWIRDTLTKNSQVWGIGRGSSCASLVLFLLDINMVDPVKYEIPMEEFYK